MDTRLRHGIWIITSIMCGFVWLYFIHLRPWSKTARMCGAALSVCTRRSSRTRKRTRGWKRWRRTQCVAHSTRRRLILPHGCPATSCPAPGRSVKASCGTARQTGGRCCASDRQARARRAPSSCRWCSSLPYVVASSGTRPNRSFSPHVGAAARSGSRGTRWALSQACCLRTTQRRRLSTYACFLTHCCSFLVFTLISMTPVWRMHVHRLFARHRRLTTPCYCFHALPLYSSVSVGDGRGVDMQHR